MSEGKAQFIAEARPCRPGDPAPYFRREFQVEPGWLSATLEVTGLGIVAPYLNGRPVGDEVLLPGWTTYDQRLMVSRFDVTADLCAGANALGAILGQGWACGPFLFDKSIHHYCDRPALWLRLELVYAGARTAVTTGPGWLVGHGGVRANSLYDGETFDARLEPDGWAEPGFTGSGWVEASLFEWDRRTLRRAQAPPVRRLATYRPAAISTAPNGRTIVDFGQNIAGFVHLDLSDARPGQTITLRHAEALTPEGALEPESNRTAEATDRYICRGHAREQWEPRFTYHGFRYVELDGLADPAPGGVTALAIWSDMTERGWFTSSNPQLNRLHANTVHSMRANFVSVPTDCPQRDERLGWTGDLNAFIPTAAFLYDVRAVVESWLEDLMIAQARVGNMPRSAPLIDPRPSQPTALWGDAIVNVPWVLYQEYGDVEILRRCWPAMVSYVAEVASLLSEEGLWDTGFQYGDWCDPDAPPTEPGQAKTDRYLIAQAFYARSCAQMVQIARLLGEPEAEAAALAARVRQSFRRAYVRPDGAVVGRDPAVATATGYALAICFGLLKPGQQALAGDRLADLVASRDHVITTGFAGTPFVADALTLTGHLDAAYRLLLQPNCPGFIYPVRMGATTTWERWDAILPDGRIHRTGMTSLNHYALGAINDWVHRVVGGLGRAAPGWARLVVAPRPGGGLTRARVSHLTGRGLASVEWRLHDAAITVRAVVPPGTLARVELPAGEVLDVGPGEHVWTYPYSQDGGCASS